MSSEQADLKSVVDQLSEKTHLLSDEAILAKSRYEDDRPVGWNVKGKRKWVQMEIFNQNVKVLTQVFRHAHVDSFMDLVTRPRQLLTLQLFIGFFRGIGFAIGMGAVLGLVFWAGYGFWVRLLERVLGFPG